MPVSITLERRVAKCEFSYELVGEAKESMTVDALKTRFVPRKIKLFGENDGSVVEDFYEKPTASFPSLKENETAIFYLPENKQGNVEGITDQSQRNGQTAPRCATYLYLDGYYGTERTQQYGFSIYLGDDMEGGNFDVNGNAHYHIHLELGGPDPNDIRISLLKFEVKSHFANVLRLGEQTSADIEMTCSNYFNDELTLVCSAIGARGAEFDIYELNEDGSLGSQLDGVQEEGDFVYKVMVTDNKPGERKIKCRVFYRQTQMGSVSRVITQFLLATRYADWTTHPHPIEIED